MSAVWKHFKTVCRHKWEVFKECAACGIFWQGVTHDLSKFSWVEFWSSAKHFQGNKSPHYGEAAEKGYSLAWLHHKGCNPHHWEFWTDFYEDTGELKVNKIPYKYVVEMVCDWIGAGKVYNSGDWKQSDTLDYYNKVRQGRHFHPDTECLILGFLYYIKDKGLDEFHKMARGEGGYSHIRKNYERIDRSVHD